VREEEAAVTSERRMRIEGEGAAVAVCQSFFKILKYSLPSAI
jgi:hypothetical protein